MKADLSAVAVEAPTTSVSANVLQIARFFERGVPADDAACVRMMRALNECNQPHIDTCCIRVAAGRTIDVIFRPVGYLQDLDDGDGTDLQCDAYSQDEALQALFWQRTEGASDSRLLGSIRARATPDGCRRFVRDVRAAARALRENGLCPRCPDQAAASMRLPHASFCGKCCWGVALLGDEQ